MMKNVFFIHGVGGNGKENWFPWLKMELERSCNVIVPVFPTPENKTLKNWLAVFDNFLNCLSSDSLVVGHSLGVAFLLNVLERCRVKAAFFVAGVSGPLKNKFDEKMKTFSHRKFDWESIRRNCTRFYVFHSDNDPYVPLGDGFKLAENLGAELILLKGAGHINAAAGFTEFPLLLDKIRKEF